MAKEVISFNQKNAQRIANSVRYAEGMQRKGSFIPKIPSQPYHEIIFAKLISKDPSGSVGYWEAKEARYYEGEWHELENGKLWDNSATKYPYIRHYNHDDAEEGNIVRVFLIYNSELKINEWVFDNNVTNPNGFVYYSDEGTNGQATINATWTIKNLGKVCTNVGELDVLNGVDLVAGAEASVKIIFVDDGGGFKLLSAAMELGTGPFWTQTLGTITVYWRIAKVEDKGDFSRLIQYYAGDIHLTVFAFSYPELPDPPEPPYDDQFTIVGDNKWIDVTLAGNVYTVSHRVPNPDEPQFDFQAIDKNFDCSDTLSGGASLGDVITKVNAILGALQHVFYDTKGHIYKLTDCAEAVVDETDDSGFDYYEATLVTSNHPEPTQVSTVGGELLYTITKNGASFTDWVAVKKSVISFRNSLGNFVYFNIGGGEIAVSTALLTNVAGDSAQKWTNADGDDFLFTTNGYRYNDQFTCKAAIQSRQDLTIIDKFDSAECTVAITMSSYSLCSKDKNPQETYQLTVNYSIPTILTSGKYYAKLRAYYGVFMDLITDTNGNSLTQITDENPTDIKINIPAGMVDGGQIIIYLDTYSVAENYDANISTQVTMTYQALEFTLDVVGSDSNGETVNLEAGTWDVYYISGAVQYSPSPDASIALKIERISDTSLIDTVFNLGSFATSAEAEAAGLGLVETVTIPTSENYQVYFSDTVYGDNSGTIRIRMVKVG